jgi:hypothetical protein
MVACVVAAIAALLLGYQAAWDLYLTGFPDGHLTDYDKRSMRLNRSSSGWSSVSFPYFWSLLFTRSAHASVPLDCSPP